MKLKKGLDRSSPEAFVYELQNGLFNFSPYFLFAKALKFSLENQINNVTLLSSFAKKEDNRHQLRKDRGTKDTSIQMNSNASSFAGAIRQLAGQRVSIITLVRTVSQFALILNTNYTTELKGDFG